MKTINLIFVAIILILILYIVHSQGYLENLNNLKMTVSQYFMNQQFVNNIEETEEEESILPSEDELTQYAVECIEKYSVN